ncbi:bifunctional transcriptional activator/DNA repair enzyme AdaA [Paenibacillus sp. GCM10023252]|uniref:bifunctional transcriptional activator/DNA repair enzyme AdaA n=1 Tax=Paenibacillus sp. GCM10023252 TaxID=3252649 RepID=UPI00361CFC55
MPHTKSPIPPVLPTQEQWDAIIQNDSAYDGTFFYAVKTTGIYCRPSCKSKPPLQQHVEIFPSPDRAAAAQFRPCKRCKPEGRQLPDEEWVLQLTELIQQRYAEPLPLQELADRIHGSPYHIQRTFSRIMGTTPAEYTQQIRIQQASRLLTTTKLPITEVAAAVGLTNASHFSTLFRKLTGKTPTEYRNLSLEKEALLDE